MAEARDLVIIISGSLIILVTIFFAVLGFMLYRGASSVIKTAQDAADMVKSFASYLEASKKYLLIGGIVGGFIQAINALKDILGGKREAKPDGK